MQSSTRLVLLLVALLLAVQLVCATSHRSPLARSKPRPCSRDTTHSTQKHRLLSQGRLEYAPVRGRAESDAVTLPASKQRFVLAVRSSLASAANTEVSIAEPSSTTSRTRDGTRFSAPPSPSKAATSLASALKPTLEVNSVPSVESFAASRDRASVTTTSTPGALVSLPESPSSAAPSHSFVPAAAAAATQTKPRLMVMPGRTLSVFPIGLFVFGSLNGIALLATAYMFWERRCYARQFAERRRREKGASKSVQARSGDTVTGGPLTSSPI